jgi:hypothetical protein
VPRTPIASATTQDCRPSQRRGASREVDLRIVAPARSTGSAGCASPCPDRSERMFDLSRGSTSRLPEDGHFPDTCAGRYFLDLESMPGITGTRRPGAPRVRGEHGTSASAPARDEEEPAVPRRAAGRQRGGVVAHPHRPRPRSWPGPPRAERRRRLADVDHGPHPSQPVGPRRAGGRTRGSGDTALHVAVRARRHAGDRHPGRHVSRRPGVAPGGRGLQLRPDGRRPPRPRRARRWGAGPCRPLRVHHDARG